MLVVGCALNGASAPGVESNDDEFAPLFSGEELPKGWVVRHWDDVSQPPAKPTSWTIEHGVLHGSRERGTWLMSNEEYTDFILEFEFKLGPRGNGGLALARR